MSRTYLGEDMWDPALQDLTLLLPVQSGHWAAELD
jgi:hypothetical protein